MSTIGVIEGFFGPQWPSGVRESYAQFLAQYGGDFYIYAPKEDPFLRKGWRNQWDQKYQNKLKNLVNVFHSEGIKFGVGFSPFGLGSEMTQEDRRELEIKLNIMNQLGVDILGLFFDDMPVTDNLSNIQIESLKLIQKIFKHKIIFCPSYYTPDPILDKVFGNRPENYLQDLADRTSKEVALAWTGPKVISPEIDRVHLQEVSRLLKRKPFIWENFFANDGPRNCKFLKLKPYSGREREVLNETEGFGLNLMNQPQLSKILFLSAKLVLEGANPGEAFEKSLDTLCSGKLKAFILKHQDKFLNVGLEKMSAQEKSTMTEELSDIEGSQGLEIKDWLEGKYEVDSDCLTD
jgi:hyaluronoglucosaminidase